MKIITWGIQLLIPLVVLYTIGYFIVGFSALTIPWIILLSVLIFLGERFVQWTMGRIINRFGRLVVNFLVAAVIIFTLTLAIEGGNVPLGGALLAAAIIALLTELIYSDKINVKRGEL